MTVLLARYLGPEKFGVLAYSFSLAALFGTAGHMGLSGLVVREIVKKPDLRAEILGTSFALKALGYTIGSLFLIIFASISEKSQTETFWILIIAAVSLLPQPVNIFDFWFQAHVQAKYTAIARSIGLLLSASIKVIFVLIGAELIFFAIANLLQAILTALVLIIIYHLTTTVPIASWSWSIKMAKELFDQGWMIFLGSIFAVMYLKIDQVMLKWLVGAEEVGVYAVAATLSEAWYFVPTAIVASIFPKLIKLHETNLALFKHRLQQVFDLLFLIALGVAIVITILADPLISLFFGQNYHNASPILTIHIWAALFIFMRAAFSKWILIENALVFSLITQGFGALINVVLNLLLIPRFSGKGAAMATLISYATASYFSLFFYKKTQSVFWMMSCSFFAPVRYILGISKIFM